MQLLVSQATKGDYLTITLDVGLIHNHLIIDPYVASRHGRERYIMERNGFIEYIVIIYNRRNNQNQII
jgi:hypothetical protein